MEGSRMRMWWGLHPALLGQALESADPAWGGVYAALELTF